MRIEITSKSLDLTDSMRDHVEKRLAKLTKYFDGILDCHVIARAEKFIHRVELTLHGQGFDLFSEGSAEDFYAAFDSAEEKMERQVRKLKEKIRQKRGRKAPLVGSPEAAAGAEDATEEA
jgi:putative sigma-54 modulation protein